MLQHLSLCIFSLLRESESRSVVSNSLRPRRLYSPWNSPGQNTGVGSLFLLQGIFPTQGSNPGLPHCRWVLYQLSYQGSSRIVPIFLAQLKTCCLFTKSCPTLCDPVKYTVHGILQARILEWVAFSFSRGSSQPYLGYNISAPTIPNPSISGVDRL